MHRKPQGAGGAEACGALETDGAAVLGDDVAHNRESQACTFMLGEISSLLAGNYYLWYK